MTYGEAIAYLHALSQFGFQPGLATTFQLAAAVDNPQGRLRFIHVAGTNGKGSTCAMLESVYRQAGLRVGLYTSPHLVRFGERIQVDRNPIPDDDLVRLTSILEARVKDLGLTPTFFEFTTILALLWFAEVKCELVIWETGLGGRLDSTNIVTPLACVITSIGLDHMHVLGTTLTAIASEKAGILKSGVPAIIPAKPEEARREIERYANQVGAPVVLVGEQEADAVSYPLSLVGSHQRANAAAAIAVVGALQHVLPVPEEILRLGLANTQWAGRLQRIQRGHQTLILDGAHNRDGILALRDALQELRPGTKPAAIIGFLADKEWREMAGLLAPICSKIWTVPVASRRSLAPQELQAALLEFAPTLDVVPTATLAVALDASQSEPFLLVTGSLYLVGEAIELLELATKPEGNQRDLNEWGGGIRTAPPV
ncbi:MAG TPA: folylpolyglutamate synthase/dihydrofolate synthase family protein [Candidatus Limnocylindria bacterium]|jgi:dihydrofolate synthase/folylpolyglutamate synthase|nr:folylpolyglutamate synthase/dihydrofolate synthase family protein [Candidatus Limnocylindria bacterium]